VDDGVRPCEFISNGRKFAITQSGRLSIAFPCDFEYHEAFVANRVKSQKQHAYMIMGRICTSADWLFKNKIMPELKYNDVIAVMDAGAYFSSYATTFSFPRPAIVMIENGKIITLRRKETTEDITALDIL
jgi:diaminopimelate decarboxylase